MTAGPEYNRFLDYLLFRSIEEGGGTTAEWRRSAPENEAYARELERLLALTADAYRPDAFAEPPSAAALLRQPRRTLGRGRLHWWIAVAGAAAVILWFAVPRRHTGSQDLPAFGVEEFATGSHDRATVQLRDGTVVRLGPGSRLRLTGAIGAREVALQGKAYFAVSRMQGRPFTVHTGGGDIVVLGTRFEAESRGDDLRLMVVEGRVALRGPGSAAELGPGEMTRVVEGAASVPVRVADPLRLLGWTGNFLVFQRTPIDEVAAEVQRHFGVSVRVVGSNLADQTVTASFTDAAAGDVIRVVCTVLAARCSIGDAQATIDLTQSVSPSRRAQP